MKNQPKIAAINRNDKARRIVKTDTQKIRLKLIEILEEIFLSTILLRALPKVNSSSRS
jgi:hypothetical protein